MGIRLVIIKLERYNEVGELLIKNRIMGLQPHVRYRDRDRRVSVTGVAVCMEEKWRGMHTIGL